MTKGSYGLEKQSFSYLFGDKKTSLLIQYLNSISQNDFEYINTGLPNSPLEVQEYASKSAKQYILNYGYQNEKNQIGFNFWQSNNFREVPVGMLSNNPYAKQWDDALRTKFFYKQIGANHKLELIYAYLEEDFRYISNSILVN